MELLLRRCLSVEGLSHGCHAHSPTLSYICRLSSFSRFTRPSVCPWLKGTVSACTRQRYLVAGSWRRRCVRHVGTSRESAQAIHSCNCATKRGQAHLCAM